jgi:hypothetical protein
LTALSERHFSHSRELGHHKTARDRDRIFMILLKILIVLFPSSVLGQRLRHISRRPLAALSYEKNYIKDEATESWIRDPPQKSNRAGGNGNQDGSGRWNSTKGLRNGHSKNPNGGNEVFLFVHIAKTGGSSFDEILKGGVNNIPADCIVEKKHYEDRTIPLTDRYNFPTCRLISTEFSRFQISKFLIPKSQSPGSAPVPSSILSHVKFLTILREPFARLLSQYRHDKYYTPRRFKDCPDLATLVEHGATCIEKMEPAYRYQNFQSMMLGG